MITKKTIRLLFKILGIFVGLLIILAIVLPLIFKKQIVNAVKTEINKNLNATVDFKDYHLSLFRNFPDFSLGLDHVTVAGKDDFVNDTLAKIENIRVSLDILSVLKGDVYKIKKINIDKPELVLKVLKDGKANWDIVKPPADTTETTEPGKTSGFELAIKKLSINSADIRFDDYSSGMHAKIVNLNHSLSGNLTQDFTTLVTNTSIDSVSFSYSGITYLKNAVVKLKADIDADLKKSKYTFKENEFQLNELFLAFDGWLEIPEKDINMDLKFRTKKTEFKNILSLIPAVYARDFSKIETKGNIALDGFAKGTYNEQQLPVFALSLKIDNAMFKYPDLPKAVTNINMDAKVSNATGKADATVINIKKLHLEMGNNPADIKLLVSTPISDPNIDGNIKLKLNLDEIKDFYLLESGGNISGKLMADVSLKGKLSSVEKGRYEEFQAKGEITLNNMKYSSGEINQDVVINELRLIFNPKVIELAGCSIKSGKSDIQAKGRIDNLLYYVFKDELLTGSFTTTSQLIDLNEFLTSTGTGNTANTGNKEDDKAGIIEVPANINFALQSSFGKVLYDNFDLNNVNGSLSINNRKLSLQNLKMNTLDGSIIVAGSYSTQKNQPEIDFAIDLSSVDILKTYKTFVTLQKFSPIAERCSGKVSIKAKLNTVLDQSMNPDYNTLNADGNLAAHQLELKGPEVLTKIADALKIDKFRRIGIDKTSISFRIANGRLNVNPFSFTFEKIKMTVSGYNSLDEKISYDIICEIPREMFGNAANGVLNNLVSKARSKGLNINPGNTVVVGIKVGGTMSNPTITTDLKSSVAEAVNDIKNQVVETAKEKVNEAVNTAKAEVEAQIQKLMAEANQKAQLLKDEARKAGDLLIAEAEKQGKALVDQASNPITKAAAKETSKQLVKTAQEKSDKLQKEAAAKADKILADAQQQADKLKSQK